MRHDGVARRGTWSPASLHDALGVAASRCGLGEVAVEGVVLGVRSRGSVTGFELVEYDGAGMPCAVVPVLVDERRAGRFVGRRARELEGSRAEVHGNLEPDPPFGRVRLVAHDVAAGRENGRPVAGAESAPRAVPTGIQGRSRLPARPRLVGVVSALGGAGGEDVRELLASAPRLGIIEEAVPMSGPAAPEAIRGALRRLARRGVDLILVARGGGARSNLVAFDHPTTVQAIESCAVPVWTAVGHARDRTGADQVALASFATPSAAALELVARVSDASCRDRAVDDDRVRRSPLGRTIALAVLIAVVVVLALAVA